MPVKGSRAFCSTGFKELEDMYSKAIAEISKLSVEKRLLAYSILGSIMCKKDDFALEFMNSAHKLGLDKSDRAQLMNIFNESILFEKSLEFTSHGIKKSFRFWSREEKSEYIDFANSVIKSLESISKNICVGYGTSLALGRSNDFISHDDDIDLIIGLDKDTFPTFSDGLQAIEEEIAKFGYRASGDFVSHRHIIPKDGGPSLDLFVGAIEHGFFSSYPGPRGKILVEEVFPAQRVLFLDREIALPRNLDAYLSKLYGDNWRIPDPTFSHNWDRESYSDLMKGAV